MDAVMRTQRDAPQLDLTIADHELYERGSDDVVPATKLDMIAGKLIDMGAGGLAFSMARAFDYMRLAEEEIEQAVQRHPEHTEKLKRAFQYLAWMDPQLPTDEVYRGHARQLLERIVNGDSLNPGTWAEALMALSKASMKAPLNQKAMAAMYIAMERTMGPVSMQFYVAEPYQGAAMELLSALITKGAKERDVSKICGLNH